MHLRPTIVCALWTPDDDDDDDASFGNFSNCHQAILASVLCTPLQTTLINEIYSFKMLTINIYNTQNIYKKR